jgi:hypothetical protein
MCNLRDPLPNTKPESVSFADRRIGFRWCSLKRNGEMRPISWHGDEGNNPWKQSVARADEVPTLENGNGLYIFKNLEETMKQGHAHFYWGALVQVEYWGQVIHHELGVRVERARMNHIYVDRAAYVLPGNIRYWEVPMTLTMDFQKMYDEKIGFEGVNYG